MKPRRKKSKPEPTIALINVVFLMLIFFLIAGTLTQPLDDDLELVSTRDLDPAAPPDGLIIHADGRMQANGADITNAAAYLATQTDSAIRLIPDKALPAKTLLQIGADLRAAGAETLVIATETALQ